MAAEAPFHRSQKAGERSPPCPESGAPGSDNRDNMQAGAEAGVCGGGGVGGEGHCLRSPGVWSPRDARGSFWAAGAGPWLVSASTARGTASPAHHTNPCLGWHRWPGRTTVGRRKERGQEQGRKGDAFISCLAWGPFGRGRPSPCGCASAVAPACRSARSRAWRWACPACWQTPAAPHPAAHPPAAGRGEGSGIQLCTGAPLFTF